MEKNEHNNIHYEERGINTDQLPPEELQRLVDENPELKEEEDEREEIKNAKKENNSIANKIKEKE